MLDTTANAASPFATAVAEGPGKILITADAVGGVWQYTADLVRVLQKQGIQVVVASLGPRPSLEQKRQLPNDTPLFESDFALEWTHEPWTDVDAAGAWLLALRSHVGADLVHLNGYAHAALPWDCPVVVVAHSCVLSWWQAVHACDAPPEWSEYRRRVQAGVTACDCLIAPSHFMAHELSRHYGVPSSAVQVIHNYSSAPVEAGKVKESFCLAAGRIWDPAKNLSFLTQVAVASSLPIYVAGDGALIDDGALISLGLLPHSSLLTYMARARILVHPALYEPFGLVTLEAARAGCCLVLSDIPSARELWDGAAVFVDPHRPADWIATLTELAGDPGLCARFGQAAALQAQRYSEAAFSSAYLQAYRYATDHFLSRTGVLA